MRTILIGFLAATAVNLIVGTHRGAAAASGLAAFPGTLAQRFLNPDLPAIPNRVATSAPPEAGSADAAGPAGAAWWNPAAAVGSVPWSQIATQAAIAAQP